MERRHVAVQWLPEIGVKELWPKIHQHLVVVMQKIDSQRTEGKRLGNYGPGRAMGGGGAAAEVAAVDLRLVRRRTPITARVAIQVVRVSRSTAM